MRPITTLAVLTMACGPPVIYDTSNVAVRDPLVTASVDNGWLAVDSVGTDVRVVVELHLEGPLDASNVLPLHLLRMHCAVSGEHVPAKVSQEEPRCPTPGAPPRECPAGMTPGECDALRAADENCLFTIRAEFMFDEMPHLDENGHFFTFGQTDQPIRWTRPSGS